MRYTMNAIRLKTEYLKNPIGMDIVKPRLFWNCAEGVRQTAYRIVCRDEHENVLWDSGRVESSSMQAVYAGVPLASRTRVVLLASVDFHVQILSSIQREESMLKTFLPEASFTADKLPTASALPTLSKCRITSLRSRKKSSQALRRYAQ